MNLKTFFTEHWSYLAVKAACELNLFDLIDENKNSVELLLEKTKFEKPSLNNLLYVLESLDLVFFSENKLKLTNNGRILTENHPKSLKYACIVWGEEHLRAWQHLSKTIKTGKPSFDNIYGKSFFNYLQTNQKSLEIYHKAMAEYARDDYEFIAQKINFSRHKSVLDVGGGLGVLISKIAEANPNTAAYLFEKKEVIDLVKTSNFETISGDFFVKIPAIADAIILSRIIHDWSDLDAANILTNVYNALPGNGTLYLIENVTDKEEKKFALLNLNMNIITNSFERKSEAYIALVKSVGFNFSELIPLNQLQSVFKFIKN